MSKERKPAVIGKPVIDEEAVLRFVAAAPSAELVSAGTAVQLTISLKREVYVALEREAARKSRTVEEQVRKVLTKHVGRD
jgi:hypothetical protein